MPSQQTTPRIGMKVYTLDNQLLGTVRQIWPDARTVADDVTGNTSITPDAPPPPLARPGLLLVKIDDHVLYVPFGAMERVEDDRVILGVPAEDVDAQSWDQRPWRLAG